MCKREKKEKIKRNKLQMKSARNTSPCHRSVRKELIQHHNMKEETPSISNYQRLYTNHTRRHGSISSPV